MDPFKPPGDPGDPGDRGNKPETEEEPYVKTETRKKSDLKRRNNIETSMERRTTKVGLKPITPPKIPSTRKTSTKTPTLRRKMSLLIL